MRTVRELFEPAFGYPCWQVRWDDQVGLDMSFGSPRLEIKEPPAEKGPHTSTRARPIRRRITLKGDYWLWTWVSNWRITLKDGTSATSRSGRRRKDIACARLEGEKLLDIALTPRNGRTQFHFDLGGLLEVWPYSRPSNEEPDDLWCLYKPSGYVLTVRSDGHYQHRRSRESRETWQPISIREGAA
jgi:hypothetical protein